MKVIGNTLVADVGCYLIKGENEIAESLTMPQGYDYSEWSEITIEEYNKRFEIVKEEVKDEETMELAQGEQ